MLALAGAMWWRRSGSLWARLHDTVPALCAGLFAWVVSYRNLLGFHLG